MSRTFNRFMVADDIGTNRKLRRLPVTQRWVYVAGVLALAAQSPIRGALLIADGEPATDDDIAMQATVPVKDARAALESLRGLGMLDRDEDGVEWVHDWDSMNKDPKPSDAPEATRDRKRRSRAKSRAANRPVTRPVTRDEVGESRGFHAPEVEVEVEVKKEEDAGDEIAPSGFAFAPSGLHPDLSEVLGIFRAIDPALVQVEEMAVNATCSANPGEDVIAGAHLAASWALTGDMREKHASRLLGFAMDSLAKKAAKVDGIRTAAEKTSGGRYPAAGPGSAGEPRTGKYDKAAGL